MDYNINFKYKAGEKISSNVSGMRKKAIEASERQSITQKSPEGISKIDKNSIKPVDSKNIIDSNVKVSTNLLKLNQSIVMLNATIKKQGIGQSVGGGGGGVGVGGSGLGSVGAAAGYIGIPVALAGFAIQKINQIGNAYIEKVSQQKGTVGVAGFTTRREGAYLAPEVSQATKAYRMATGKMSGQVDPMAFKMGTIFGQSAEEIGSQSGKISRYGMNYGEIASTGAGAGIQTELPKFMQAISSELEESVRNGVNSSNMAGDIGDELAALTSKTQTKSVEMALGIVSKTKSIQQSAAKGQIGSVESLMMWKAGQTKLMENLNSEDRGVVVDRLEKQQLLTPEEAKRIRTGDISKGGAVSEEFLRQQLGQGGYTSLVRDNLSSISGAEASRLSMKEVQKTWGTGVAAFRQWNAMYPSFGGEKTQNELLTEWRTAKEPVKIDKKFGESLIKNKYKEVEGSAPMLGVQKAQMMDELLYKNGESFAQASIKMEKALIDMANTLSGGVIPALELFMGKNKTVKTDDWQRMKDGLAKGFTGGR